MPEIYYIVDKIAIPLSTLAIACSTFTIWKLSREKGSRNYIMAFIGISAFNILVQIYNIVYTCIEYYYDNYSDWLQARRTVYSFLMLLSNFLLFAAVLSDCMMVKIVLAIRNYNGANERRIVLLWTAISTLVFLSSNSLNFFFFYLNVTKDKTNDRSLNFLSYILVTVYASFVMIYDAVQNLYISISFYKMVRKQNSVIKRHFFATIALIVLGFILDGLAFIFANSYICENSNWAFRCLKYMEDMIEVSIAIVGKYLKTITL